MRVLEIQFAPWDQKYFFQLPDSSTNQAELKKGDEVIVETTLGVDLGIVSGLGELAESGLPEGEVIKPILRTATAEDRLKYLQNQGDKMTMLDVCRQLIRKHQLDMGLVDVRVSFDDLRLTYAFVSDSRVDFRELVKELIKHFHKNVRLQQIGVRDAAKHKGDMGPCGRTICCKTFLHELGNVSTDCAKCQQIANRGSDRLSGVCNRLKCCLKYEQALYEEMSKNLPAIGSRIKTEFGQGTVLGHQPLKKIVNVSIDVDHDERRKIVEVEIK